MLGNTSTFTVEKSAPDALCMVFRVTCSGENADLDSISPNSSLSDYNIIPIARSFNGYDWRRTAGPYAQSLGIVCDDSECQLSIPTLSDLLEGRFVLMPFQHSVSEKAEISRFFHQTTFGPTMKMINEWDYNSGLSTEMSKWVRDQIDINVTPSTSHREFFRRQLNYQLSLGEEAANINDNKKQMFKVRKFCNAGARWAKYAFTTEDQGKYFTVTQETNGLFAIKKQGSLDLVTIVEFWQDEHGLDLGEGTFQVLWRLDETQSGRVHISQNDQTKFIQNPEIRIPLNDPNFLFVNLPDEEHFSSTPIIAMQNIWNNKWKYEQQYKPNTNKYDKDFLKINKKGYCQKPFDKNNEFYKYIEKYKDNITLQNYKIDKCLLQMKNNTIINSYPPIYDINENNYISQYENSIYVNEKNTIILG